ncbi:hypothetical protein ACRCUN_02445 [Mycobacterium sp. LTG2003]
MPGEFGTLPNEDGVVATTASRDANGMVGTNTDTQPVAAGGNGGAGVRGTTLVPDGAGVAGENEAPTGAGVYGRGPSAGVQGTSEAGAGLHGLSDSGAAAQVESRIGTGLLAFAHNADMNTVHAINDATTPRTRMDAEPRGAGVLGQSTTPGAAGVHGLHSGTDGAGVRGRGPDAGVDGHCVEDAGVLASSVRGNGVEAVAEGTSPFTSYLRDPVVDEAFRRDLANRAREAASRLQTSRATNLAKTRHDSLTDRVAGGRVGVPGWVREVPDRLTDRLGVPVVPIGIGRLDDALRDRPRGNGVWGHTKVAGGSGVLGTVEPGTRDVAGVTGVGDTAGRFYGAVEIVGSGSVTGTLEVGGNVDVRGSIDVLGDVRLVGADFAEGFDALSGDIAPGSVMVMDDNGGLTVSSSEYDTRVAGVVSGAGDLRPGILLDQAGDQAGRVPIALVGKVYVWVDAEFGEVRVGDLLTTSPVQGHAMKASDPSRAFGAVLGKAMQPLADGRGLVRVLVSLQ